MQADLKLSSKPPLSENVASLNKRHSLNVIEPLKRLDNLVRRGSHELARKENWNSCGNLRLLDSKYRSVSLAQLKASGRTLSASNLAALSDSNLSIKVAVPRRSYELFGSESNLAKQSFEVVVKRYYKQLTVGCGRQNCWNMFCASNGSGKLKPRLASYVSIELATSGKEYFCKDIHGPTSHLELHDVKHNAARPASNETTNESTNESSNETTNEHHWGLLHKADTKTVNEPDGETLKSKRGPVSFLQRFFSCSPFKFLFTNEPCSKTSKIRSNTLRDFFKTIALSGSDTSLNVETCKAKNMEKIATLEPPVGSNTKVVGNDLVKAFDSHKIASLESVDLHSDIENVNVDDGDLEEFEDQCVLEMSSENLRQLSLTHLTLSMLEIAILNYNDCEDPSFILSTIRTVFSCPEAVNASFRYPSSDKNHNSLKTKSSVVNEHCHSLDIASVRCAYLQLLRLVPSEPFSQTLLKAAEVHLRSLETASGLKPKDVFQLIILLENPLVVENKHLLQILCTILADLEANTRDCLIDILANYDRENFLKILKSVQALLSSKLHVKQCSEPRIITICLMLSLLYEANLESATRPQVIVDNEHFYNRELSEKLDYKLEYENWMGNCDRQKRTILDFPFILEAASKVRIMRIHALWQMGSEYRDAIVSQAKVRQANEVYEEERKAFEDSVKAAMSPFLVLELRRDYLIEDALLQIKQKESDLKKALKIKYVGSGEEGLDLGGLQKEFFHIIINDIIRPEYGMFTYLEDVQTLWIDSNSFESDILFELVGTLLGIAIYNGIILHLHFPLVIYKKLLGYKTGLEDLKDVDPTLARSLQSLLDYNGDVYSTFCYTFQISRRRFDKTFLVDLKENGDNEAVTNENREEFVELYVEYLLNGSISPQFNALSRGFHKVCDDFSMKLFRPEELELLICGSPNVDFASIQDCSVYENGFSASHRTVIAFWNIVDAMRDEDKQLLLLFVTGSDRVPLKGLSNVSFQIVRHGEDTDKLPTALTCFNQLLLPEYSSEEKLRNRLYLAIQNSKGFGLT